MGNGSIANNYKSAQQIISAREAEGMKKIRAFLFDLINADVYGYQCSSVVQDKARALLGLPAFPASQSDVMVAQRYHSE
jgi:hypothetical protein